MFHEVLLAKRKSAGQLRKVKYQIQHLKTVFTHMSGLHNMTAISQEDPLN